MICPACKNHRTIIIYTVPKSEYITERTRHCHNCQHRFTTVELIKSLISGLAVVYAPEILKMMSNLEKKQEAKAPEPKQEKEG